MSTAKKANALKALVDENQIISMYMNDVLEDNHNTKNVYVFCKNNSIEESDFYNFFGSIAALKQAIWVKFLENAIDTLKNDENYNQYPSKNKLLSLYFTLFEILTLNRSYVVYTLAENKEGLKNVIDLKNFREAFKSFITEIMQTNTTIINDRINKFTQPAFAEGAWIQFLFILKFWINDTSKGFEKTDIVIEKSVNTVVDLLDSKPIENLIDFGKFLWKEKMM